MRFPIFTDELGRIAAHGSGGKIEKSLHLFAPPHRAGLQLAFREVLQKATARLLPGPCRPERTRG